ncbi:DUF3566 domain-containing protein [Streptacidiphilus sp. PB12-B1b]|uniref:DUF3566 domain-containing protein n=1 Tax=Streptacidiphilus sp. PB12-B1b TaxID=2705012 RepID=UPI0015F9C2A7|nr:DUF3566 domain-containing protein [Streptacidiphilus sp. PB12-B1b]QMU74423.1 DUF3566 domain-containing protein [Streptacidiphilus sp. PB12-B1b]
MAGGQLSGHDAAATAVRPSVAGGGTAAARRRQADQQAGPGGQPQTQAMSPAAPAAAPAGGRSGYSTPTTYQKGQPTPPGGTRVPTGSGQPEAAPRPGPAAPASGRTRRARLRVTRTDPWSVMKISFLLSIALGVVTIVGVSLLWMLLDTAGVFSSVGGTLKQATGSDNNGGFDLQSYLSFGNVLMTTALIAVIDVVLLTALATLGSFIYNMAAGISGGVELTLSEED